VTPQVTVCEEFAYRWGAPEQGNFSFPMGAALDGDGSVYVLEQQNAHRIQVFTPTGAFLRSWGGLNWPRGIAIDKAAGEVYVVNEVGNNVQVYSLTGTLLRTMTGFNAPQYVALDGLGHMYVSNFNTQRVLKYTTGNGTTAGALVGTLGTGGGSFDGQLNGPTGVAVGPDGNVYVGELNNNRISVFAPTGEFLRKFGGPGSGPGQFNGIRHMEFDAQGRLWVGETGNDRVQVVDAFGGFLGQLGTGSAGNAEGQFNDPHGFVVRADGAVWVADRNNHRVQVFNPCGTVATATPTVTPQVTVCEEFAYRWGAPEQGNFSFPMGTALDGDGSVYVLEQQNAHRIQVFTPTGAFLRSWGGLNWPRGIAID
jgi:DNA-binding beta-propeller fold protein YncE